MTAPILLPDVHKIKRSATSRPQNLPRKHLSPKVKTDQGGFEPPTIACNRLGRTLRLQRQRHIHWATGPVAENPSTHKKSPAPTTPQHTEGKSKKDLGASGFCPAQVQKNSLEHQHTAVARNRAALATSLLVDTLADKQVAACIHSSHNAQSCKANRVSSRLKL